MKAQALLKAPAHPHENEEESEGLGTSSSVVLIGYTHIPRQHVGDGAGENLAENARTFSLKRAGHRRGGGDKIAFISAHTIYHTATSDSFN